MTSIHLRIGQYQVLETIGVGSFGKVKLAVQEQTGQKVALKFVNRKRISAMDNMVSRMKREIQYLKCLRHPHIIKLFEVITTPTDIILVLEYAGGELFDYIVEQGRLPEDEARRLFQQIIAAVEHCHRHQIVHRDLKPENVLLDEYKHVKIADFGLSNWMRDGDFLQTSCGSPNYASPEVISGKLYAGPEVDIWSCGVILFVMLTGKLPFDDENIPNLFKKISGGLFTIPSYLSADTRHLLLRMLEVDPLKRITIQGIRQTPWFQKNLPDYLQPLPEMKSSTDVVDDILVQDLVRKMGISPQEVKASLAQKQMNQVRLAYQLLADQKEMIWNHKNKGDSPHLFPSSPPTSSPNLSFKLKSNAQQSPPILPKTPSPTIRPLSLAIPSSVPNTSGTGLPPRRQAKARPKWHYGIRSKSHPLDIMAEIYSALKKCDMEWKVLGPFHIRVRQRHDSSGLSPVSQPKYKFDITLYKVDAESYLVDFKNVPCTQEGSSVALPNGSRESQAELVVSQSAGLYSFFEATTKLVSQLAMT